MNELQCYQAPTMSSWQGRPDAATDEYLYQIVKPLDINRLNTEPMGFAFIGFCCDEGVIRNYGRPGAKAGPDELRKALAKLAIHQPLTLYDAGSIICHEKDLEAAQTDLGKAVHKLLAHGLKPIVLGGGHETTWGHYQGIEHFLKTDPVLDLNNFAIINIDAHFDLREPLKGGLGSSGTPFRQIASSRQTQHLDFNYYCLGIQPQANTRSLFETAKALNTHYLTAEKIYEDENTSKKLIQSIIEQYQHIYLTICLDAFAAHVAPGVSAPQPFGLLPQHVLPWLQQLAQSNKLVSFDIVELAPKYDIDQHTAKLGASLLNGILSSSLII